MWIQGGFKKTENKNHNSVIALSFRITSPFPYDVGRKHIFQTLRDKCTLMKLYIQRQGDMKKSKSQKPPRILLMLTGELSPFV